jgi:hypothetical protein
MLKTIAMTAATVGALLAMGQNAFAHNAREVEHILQDHGYSRIEFTSTNPSNYMANACRGGTRYHFHVNNYGEVTERREIGPCYNEREHGRRHFWSNWRNRG